MPFVDTLSKAETPTKRRTRKQEAAARERELKLVTRVNDDLKLAKDSFTTWVDEARECERFYDGNQWDPEVKKTLEERRSKPALTINRIAKKVDLVDGTEVYHRQKVIFLPKQAPDPMTPGMADLATDTVDWAIEQSKGHHERSRLWHDANVRGVGCGSYRMDHEDDPRGRIVIERVDSFEMRWDPAARMQNLEDARWIARRRYWHIDEIRAVFGDEKADRLTAGARDPMAPPSMGPDDNTDLPTQVVDTSTNPYADNSQKVFPGAPEGRQKGMFYVTEYQWWEREPCMLVVDRGFTIERDSGELDEPEQPAGGDDEAAEGEAMQPPLPMDQGTPPPPDAAAMGAALGMAGDPSAQQAEGSPAGPVGGPVPPGGAPPADGSQGAPPDAPAPPPPPEEPSVTDDEPEEDKILRLSMDEYEKLVARLELMGMPEPEAVQSTRRGYHQSFLCEDVVLSEDRMWIDGFSYLFLTHKWDDEKKVWYGMVRHLRDPQKGANKFFSQGINIWNAGAKGGLIVEHDAVYNPNALPDQWAGPSPIILMNPGMQGKYEVIPAADFPPAAAQMTEYTLAAINDIGPNESLMGGGAGDQAGVSIEKQQVQGMTTLAPQFDALTRYRFNEAKLLLKMVRRFISDGRKIRIGGAYSSKFIRLFKDRFLNPEDYDLVIDEVPRDPNARRAVWNDLSSLLPIAFRSGRMPDAWKRYSPLPAHLVEDWIRQDEEDAQQPPPPSLETDPRYIEAQIALEQANALAKQAQAQLAMARAQTLMKATGMEIASTAKDMDIKEREMRLAEVGETTDAALQHTKNELDALKGIHAMQKPAFSGVKSTG